METPGNTLTNLLLVEDSLATRKLLASLINGSGEQCRLFEAGSAAAKNRTPENP